MIATYPPRTERSRRSLIGATPAFLSCAFAHLVKAFVCMSWRSSRDFSMAFCMMAAQQGTHGRTAVLNDRQLRTLHNACVQEMRAIRPAHRQGAAITIAYAHTCTFDNVQSINQSQTHARIRHTSRTHGMHPPQRSKRRTTYTRAKRRQSREAAAAATHGRSACCHRIPQQAFCRRRSDFSPRGNRGETAGRSLGTRAIEAASLVPLNSAPRFEDGEDGEAPEACKITVSNAAEQAEQVSVALASCVV